MGQWESDMAQHGKRAVLWSPPEVRKRLMTRQQGWVLQRQTLP